MVANGSVASASWKKKERIENVLFILWESLATAPSKTRSSHEQTVKSGPLMPLGQIADGKVVAL